MDIIYSFICLCYMFITTDKLKYYSLILDTVKSMSKHKSTRHSEQLKPCSVFLLFGSIPDETQ